jgi:hypothetical protein
MLSCLRPTKHLILGQGLKGRLCANAPDNCVLLLLQLELEGLGASVNHLLENLVLLVTLLHSGVALDDLLQSLKANLRVLASLLKRGFCACGNLGEASWLILNLRLCRLPNVPDKDAAKVGVNGLEHVLDQACSVYHAH